jgi:hypothetical protein
VTAAASGPARIIIDRFDPLAGWQFHRAVAVTVSAGLARYAFTPPKEGRWRAGAEFLGTRVAAPSATGHARVVVAPPLGA